MKRINFLSGKLLRTLAGAAVLSLGMVAAVGTHASAAQVTETEPNNKSTAATAVSVNQEVTGVLSEEGDIDWYKFTLDEPGTISITYSHESTDTSWAGWYTYLYSDPEEKTCYLSYELEGGDGSLVSTWPRNVPAGTYYLKIKEESTGRVIGKNYEFTVNYTSAIGTNKEQENNDAVSKANTIEVGKEFNGSLWAQSDVDWYKFTLSEPGAVSIKFSHESGGQTYNYWHMKVFADEEESVCYFNWDFAGGDSAVKVTGTDNVPAGTYYIKVSGDSNIVGYEYGIIVNFTPAAGTNMEQESNDTSETSNVIELNKDYRGNISLEKDYDWYTFTLDKPADISVVLSHPVIDSSAYYWNVHIYGDDMTDEYMDLYWSGNKEKQTSSTTPRLAEGTYFVRVNGSSYWSSKEYTFSVNATTITPDCEWIKRGTKYYWYEGGVRQGTFNDAQGVIGDGTVRGREIYDAASNGWYWLDSIYDGAKAIGKEVWMPYIYQNEAQWDDATMRQIANESDEGMGDFVYEAMKSHTGKWVRYDNNGAMLKGWVTISGDLAKLYPDQKGNKYYYDTRTGLMAKGWITMKGKTYHFDEITGVLQ